MKNTLLLISLILVVGCAGISVFSHPKSSIQYLRVHSITPDTLFFQGQLKLKNKNPLSMSLKHMKIRLIFNEQVTIDKLIKDLPMLSGYDTKIVNFQIVIQRHELAALSGDEFEIECIGQIPVLTKHLHEPIEINYTTTLLLPKSPKIKISKSLISKDKKYLSFILDISNLNGFPLKFENILGHVDFQNYSYQFKTPTNHIDIQPKNNGQIKLIASRSSKIKPTKNRIISADLTFVGPNLKIVTPLY